MRACGEQIFEAACGLATAADDPGLVYGRGFVDFVGAEFEGDDGDHVRPPCALNVALFGLRTAHGRAAW